MEFSIYLDMGRHLVIGGNIQLIRQRTELAETIVDGKIKDWCTGRLRIGWTGLHQTCILYLESSFFFIHNLFMLESLYILCRSGVQTTNHFHQSQPKWRTIGGCPNERNGESSLHIFVYQLRGMSNKTLQPPI